MDDPTVSDAMAALSDTPSDNTSSVKCVESSRPQFIPIDLTIMLVGPPGAGKTSLLRHFRRKPLKTKYKRSTYYKFYKGTYVQVFNKTVNLELWDTGVEGLCNISLMRADAIILCFDLTDKERFTQIESSEWLGLVKKHNPYTPIILCGCKIDMVIKAAARRLASQDKHDENISLESHIVTHSEGQALADRIGAVEYIESSAVTGVGVRAVFEIAAKAAVTNPNFEYDDMDPYGDDPLASEKEKLKASTWAQTVMNTLDFYGDNPFLGVRNPRPDGTLPPKYTWYSYKQIKERVKNFGSGLRQLLPAVRFNLTKHYPSGISSGSVKNERFNVTKLVSPTHCHIIEVTWWIVSDIGATCYNFITVIVHWTLPPDDTDFIVSQAELACVICSKLTLPQFAQAAKKSPHLKYLIKIDEPVTAEEKERYGEYVTLMDISEVEKLGQENPRDVEAPGDDDLFTIEYTSGSTGKPKGIMISAKTFLEDNAVVGLGHSILLFEPLSHSERGGAKIGVFTRDDMQSLFEEFQLIRPTSIIAVPRFWNVLYTEYQKLLAIYRTKERKADPVKAEKQVRQYIYNLLGGRVLALITGGAPISRTVKSWMYKFDCSVQESYGTKEVGGIARSSSIMEDVEWRIEDVPEMGYTKNDKPFPRGELVVKTSTMPMGYFKNDEENSKTFVDGWFHTGDIVQVEKPGYVRVIDRKKDIFKLAQGEYVSPVRCEDVFQQSKFIEQIYVHGDSLQSYLVAIVVPNEAVLKQWAVENGLPPMSFDELCSRKDVQQVILEDMAAAALLHKLRSYEYVPKILVVPHRFTVENGLLTASNKLDRRAIAKRYSHEIKALYDSGEPTASPLSASKKALTSSTGAKLQQVIQKLIPEMASEKGEAPPSNNFVEMGLDSLSAISLINEIHKEFQVSVPVDTLYQPEMDVEKLATILEHQHGKEPWLIDDSSWDSSDQDAYLMDMDISNFIPDLLPQLPTITPLRELVGDEAMKEILKELRPIDSENLNQADDTTKNSDGDTPTKESENSDSNVSIKEAAAVDETTEQKVSSKKQTIKQILLTGVPGFLGCFLLVEILKAYKEAKIFCLVRAPTQEDAKNKVKEQLKKYEIDQTTVESDRVELVIGDLSLPKLGLEESLYTRLVNEIEVIFHCGAKVNGILPYSALRGPNVLGTVELIRFALSGTKNRKEFHYISTQSTVSHISSSSFISETKINAHKADSFRGMSGYAYERNSYNELLRTNCRTVEYSLSKLVSEVLLTDTAMNIPDFPLTIYRPGSISGHSKTGAANIEAFINKLLVGIVQLGLAPVVDGDPVVGMDWVPVDFAARAIVHIAKSGPQEIFYHINNPMSRYSITMKRLTTFINSYGYKVQQVSFNKWRRKLDKFMQINTNALAPLRSYFDHGFPTDRFFSCTNTLSALEGSGIERCPPITEEIVHRYLSYWVRQGALSPPQK